MKIIPFPKYRWTGGPQPESSREENLIPARSEPDDFEQEIALTRRNEPFMMV